MGDDIAGKRISCKPQKLQAMFATVKIGRGSWRKVGQARDGSSSAAVCRLSGEDEPDRAARLGQLASHNHARF